MVQFLSVVAWAGGAWAQTPLGGAIAYQGELRAAGQPAAGPVDLRFRLYMAATGGTQVGGTIDRPASTLSFGRFSQQLDFGTAAFGPDARWLEIDVRSPAGSGSYATLSPRQRVTPAPAASFASRPWETNGSGISYSDGNVGIGTTAPTSGLEIAGMQDAIKVTGFQPLLTFRDSSGGNARTILQNAGGGLHLFSESYANGSNPAGYMLLHGNGNVGIGAATPAAKLDVMGDWNGAVGALRISGDKPTIGFSGGPLSGNTSWIAHLGSGGILTFARNLTPTTFHYLLNLTANNRVGIGTTSPTKTLEVAGDAHVQGAITIGSVWRSYTIHGTELRPRWDSSPQFFYYDDAGLRDSIGVGGTPDVYYASPHLPDGATVIALELLGHDACPPADMVCALGRTNFSGATAVMADVVTNLGGQAWQTASIAYPVIDNDTHAYWVRVTMGGGGPGFEHRVYAVRILYSVTQPLP